MTIKLGLGKVGVTPVRLSNGNCGILLREYKRAHPKGTVGAKIKTPCNPRKSDIVFEIEQNWGAEVVVNALKQAMQGVGTI